MNNIFKGLGTALITPFDSTGRSIDFDSLDKLLDGQIKHGVDFVVVMGTTGESPTISWTEKMQILEFVIEKCNGRLKIVFGLGGNNTYEIAQKLQDIPTQIDGILSVSPYYNKPSQQGIINHYQYLASKTDLPIILYNVPGRTASNMLPKTVLELSKIDNIVAMKEASGNVEQVMQLLQIVDANFDILSGDDALTLPLIASGAVGLISVISNAYPQKTRELIQHTLSGELSYARNIHYKLFPIIEHIFKQGSPAGIKTLLKAKGDINSAIVRLPLSNISIELQEKIQQSVQELAMDGWA